MKKIVALFAVMVVCLSFVSSFVQVFAEKDADSLTVVDLVRLKKHIVADLGYNAELDYNEDNSVDSNDLIALRHILLGLPYPPDNKDDSELDDEGFNNDVFIP